MAEDGFAMGYALGQDSGGSTSGWGGAFGEGLWAVIILAILFGRGGFGGFGGNGGSDGVSAGFAWQGIDSGIRGVQQGICDATFSLNNTIVNGFHGVDNAVCNLGFTMQQGFNTLGTQNQQCCCETQRMIERGFCDTAQAINMQTRDLIDNQNSNYRSLMDFMVQSKIDSLQTENDALRLSASQSQQNQYLIEQLRPSPVPAYITCNPYAASWGMSSCSCGA